MVVVCNQGVYMTNLNVEGVGQIQNPINFKSDNNRYQYYGKPQGLDQDSFMLEQAIKERKKEKAKNTVMTTLQVGALLSMIGIGIPSILSLFKKKGLSESEELGAIAEKQFARFYKDVSKEKSIDEMFLTPELESKMKELKDKISRSEIYKKMNLPQSSKAMLLYGPPGTGKNTFTYAITKFFPNAKLFEFDVAAMTSPYSGMTEQNIRSATNFVLKEAEALAKKGSNEKIVVFFDEVDRVMMQDGGHNAKHSNDVLTQFKKCFNDLKRQDNVVIIGATNKHIDPKKAMMDGTGLLDEAMANRFGDKIEIVRPDGRAIEGAIVQRFKSAESVDPSLTENNQTLRDVCDTITGDKHKFSYRTLQDNIFEKIVPPKDGDLNVDQIIEAAINSKDSIFLEKPEMQKLIDLVKDNDLKNELKAKAGI
jgi:SpoVK/Ycf46/Vps4 family AAA+-type ATPase